jgi:large subunit ribosomal protein L20
MARVRNTSATKRRHKSVLKQAKGAFGKRSKNFRQAKKTVIKGLTYQYRDRKVKKREFRRLWIIRISAACQQEGMNYSRFMNGLIKANVELDRKAIAELAIHSPEAFKELVKVAQNSGSLKSIAPKKEAKS